MGRREANTPILEKIQGVTAPKTKRQVRSFLGLTCFYRESIPQYAEIATSLTDLTRKGRRIMVKWTHEQQESFTGLKKIMSEPHVLLEADLSKQFVL